MAAKLPAQAGCTQDESRTAAGTTARPVARRTNPSRPPVSRCPLLFPNAPNVESRHTCIRRNGVPHPNWARAGHPGSDRRPGWCSVQTEIRYTHNTTSRPTSLSDHAAEPGALPVKGTLSGNPSSSIHVQMPLDRRRILHLHRLAEIRYALSVPRAASPVPRACHRARYRYALRNQRQFSAVASQTSPDPRLLPATQEASHENL